MEDKKETRLEWLIRRLKEININGGDPESDHAEADDLLLKYIDERQVNEAFDAIDKWYS